MSAKGCSLPHIRHIKPFQHAMLLKAIAKIETFSAQRRLENIQSTIENYLPAGVCYNVAGMSSV